MRRVGLPLVALAIAAVGAITASEAAAQATSFTLSSPAFENNGTIPLRNSAYGDNISPALNWTGAPAGAPHRYNFRLLALHSEPNLPADLNRETLLEAIQPHVIAETVLTGVYQAQ